MNMLGMIRQRSILLVLAASALGLSACSAPRGQADGAPFDLDQVSSQRAELTTRVKAALVADERIIAASIQVVLLEGDEASGQDESSGKGSETDAIATVDETRGADAQRIRLEGFVGDENERDAALEVARKASEGIDVIDALEIR